jgi:hypothetical protein
VGTELIAIGGLLSAVGVMGVWFAEGLAEHDKKSGGFGMYRFGDVEAEGWRVVLHRLAFSAVTVVGLLVAAAGVVTLLR